MRNWYDIATPHEDIRKGNFDEAVFAAKLGDVVAGKAIPDYNDPYAFYKKTYLTEGLEQLLLRISEKLTEGKGPGVVELKTPFGGGKTHALILAYHYLKHGKRVEDLLPDGVALVEPNIAAIVGTDVNPSEGFRDGDIHRRTLWGEIAYQLGGADAYHQIEANDQDRISPGRNDLRDLLEPLQPFVLLFDEVLEYVVRARGVQVVDSTLGAQTLAFFQEITEAVTSLPRAMMIVTLPKSVIEDFGEAEEQNLATLEKIFGRLEAIYTPVQGEEVYSIIRRRLFDAIKDEGAVKEIADAYVQKYQEHKSDLPQKARDADYRRKLERAYPFHPEVIDILYEKWGTFSSFQRTRGVLRLLASVVEDLYRRERNLDMILPGDINLNQPSIRQEFLRHLEPGMESVIGSDIAGSDAKSQVLDKNNFGWKRLAERNATAVFLHSFTADKSNRGTTLPYIRFAVIRPETIPAMVTDVLQKQSNELWYLNQQGDQYYFSSVPNLNRMVLDKKALIASDTPKVREELKRRIQRELGTNLRCFLWPDASDAVSDNQELKLAVMDPDGTTDLHTLENWVNRRGSGFRVYKNTLFFALPDRDRYLRMADSITEYLALCEIQEEIAQDERPGMTEKRNEVKRRIRQFEEGVGLKVRELHRTAAVPRGSGTLERIDFGQPAIGNEKLDSWYRKELADQRISKILVRPPSENLIKAKFLSAGDAVSLSVVQEQFYKDPSLPVLLDVSFLAEAIAGGVRDKSFGIAKGTPDEIKPESLRFGDFIPPSGISFTEETLLLTEERARKVQEEIKPPDPPDPPKPPGDGDGPPPDPPKPPIIYPPPPLEEKVRRFRLRARDIPASKIADLNRGVFIPLNGQVGEFTFTIEIEVENEDGISRKVIEQQVLETLQQLGADIERKEMDG